MNILWINAGLLFRSRFLRREDYVVCMPVGSISRGAGVVLLALMACFYFLYKSMTWIFILLIWENSMRNMENPQS